MTLSLKMETAATRLRDAYWAQPPTLPDGLAVACEDPIVVTRVGRSGAAIFDLLRLTAGMVEAPLLAAYQTRLLAGHIPKIKSQLLQLAEQHQTRRARPTSASLVPTVITDVATPSVIRACSQQGVALFDQSGTCLVNAPGIAIYIVGATKVDRPSRIRLFSGRASRVVRYLLSRTAFEPGPRSAQGLATACELSYAYTHGVLSALEKRGFVERSRSRGAFSLRDPVGLLRAWVDSGESSSVVTEGFYCPTTSQASLAAAATKLELQTTSSVLFTLASALSPDEVHVSALPHGLYWNGELEPLIDAFELKRKTPHNFLALRADPLLWTRAGGLLIRDSIPSGSSLEHVGLPQLVADFAALPGRGKGQAEFLVGIYAKRLPYQLDDA